MVEFLNQDLLETDVDIIIESNNCFNCQNNGIAKIIKEKYPEVELADLATKKGDFNKLGTILPVHLSSNLPSWCILNFNQYAYGRHKRQVNYESFYRCLELSKNFCLEKGLKTIAAPKNMSCCNAGGCWPIVLCIMEQVFNDNEVTLFVCKLPEPNPF